MVRQLRSGLAVALLAISATTVASAQTIPAEIVELARALKYNPDLIYEYVHDNIETIPALGSLKGPLGTLIDRKGTPLDQAELMKLLLDQACAQSGATCSSPTVTIGKITMPATASPGAASLKNWLDVEETVLTTGGTTRGAMISVLRSQSIADNGAFTFGTNVITSVNVNWAWVKVNISGTSYAFDPATKYYNRVPNVLGSALQNSALMYNGTSFLCDAYTGTYASCTLPTGLTSLPTTSNYRNKVRGDLAIFGTNFISFVRTNFPAADLADILGGIKGIQPLTPFRTTGWTATRQASLSYQYAAPTDCSSLTSCAGTNYRSQLQITLPATLSNSLTVTWSVPTAGTPYCTPGTSTVTCVFASSDIYGSRLSLIYDSDNAVALRLNGVVLVSGTTGSAMSTTSALNVATTISHPGGYAYQQGTLRFKAGQQKYLINTGWGGSSRNMIEKHRKTLQRYQALQNASVSLPSNCSGASANDCVLGSSLALMGATWLAQMSQFNDLIDQIAGTRTNYVHGVGIVGTAAIGSSGSGFSVFVDLPFNSVSNIQRYGRDNSYSGIGRKETAGFISISGLASVLESGTIEQTQPKDASGALASAASTSKILDLAGQSYTIYDATTSNWSTVKPSLSSYALCDMGRIDTLLNSTGTVDAAYSSCGLSNRDMSVTHRVILPANGSIQIGTAGAATGWSGSGYRDFQTFTNGWGIGEIITGGQSGGYGAANYSTPAVVANQAQQSSQNTTTAAAGQTGTGFATIVADPVNGLTGDYIYSHDDIVVGSAAFPYGLGFTRSYDSGLSTQTGSPLGNGWKHNYQITAKVDSNGFQGLGDDSPASAAAAVAAIYALQDILTPATNGATVPLLNLVVSAQVQTWLMEQLTNNVVIVAQPGNTEAFTKAPNGASYIPPLGSSATLTLSGGVYSYKTRDQTTLTFNSSGNLATWQSAAGVTVTLSYTGSNLTSVSNGLGRSLTLSYTGSQLTSVSDGSRTVSYSQSGGQLTSFTDPMSKVTSYGYLSSGDTNFLNPGQLRTLKYPSFTTPYLTNLYDSLGRIKQQGDAIWSAANPSYSTAATTLFTGSGNQASHVTSLFVAGSRTQVDEGNSTTTPNTRVNYFDRKGKNLLEIVGVWGGADIYSNSVWTIDKTSAYDGRGRLVSVRLPEGNSTTYTYIDCYPTYVCATDYMWAYSIKTETQNPKSGSGLTARTKTYSYDTVFGNLASSTDFSANVTTYAYVGLGNGGAGLPSNICPPNPSTGLARTSNCFTFSYNASGLKTSETDALGRVTTYGYGTGANQADLTQVIVDQGSGRLNLRTTFAYDATGNRTSVTDGRSPAATTAYTFDANRRLTLVTPPAAAALGTQSFVYDDDGRTTAVKQATGLTATPYRTLSYTYSPSGQKLTQTDPSNNTTTFTYGDTDLLTTVTTPSGQVTTHFYDHYGRHHASYNVHDATASPPGAFFDVKSFNLNGTVAYRSDRNGYYIGYTYDGFDRPKRTNFPDSKFQEVAYATGVNKDDDVTTITTRAGQTFTATYDKLHRRLTKFGSPTVNYTYDLMGRLLTASVPTGNSHIPTGTWTRTYDTAGRRSTEVLPSSSGGKTVQYHWDAASNRIGLTYPDGTCILTQYDSVNRVTANWSNPASASCISQPSGWALQWAKYFDTAGRMWAMLRPTTTGYNTQTLFVFSEPDTQVGVVGNYLQPGAGGTFGWSASISYAYNPQRQESARATAGSALLAHPPAIMASSAYSANNVNQFVGSYIGGTSLTWDNNGNLTADGTRTYTYDAEGAGHILTATVGSTTVGTYEYDPFGRRFSKTTAAGKTYYVHDELDNEIAEYNASWQLQVRMAYDPAYLAPVAMTKADGTVTFNYFDRVGSVVAVANAAGVPLTQYAYLPFGDSSPSAAAISDCYGSTCGSMAGTGFGYVGYRYDHETGLYHTGARYYDPRLARFLQMDPIGQAGGLNLYAYVDNDPLNLVDPTGLIASKAAGVADGAYELVRKPAEDIMKLAGRFTEAPLDTAASVLNGLPQTRVGGAGLSSFVALGSIAQNAARGRQFENAVLASLGLADMKALVRVPGMAGATIPDALAVGLTEVKDVINLSYSVQLRIQVAYASFNKIPMNLVVNPTTKISQPVIDAIGGTGGNIMRFDPATKIFSPY